MIVALSAPMLVAMTGFAVDIGYWYQQQESLQSAADAAALAAATADAKYGDNSASLAQPFGVSAANTATNNQFGLTSCAGAPCGAGTLLVTMTGPTTLSNGNKIYAFTATATITRASFFSRVRGIGLSGMLPGTQAASAVADVVATTGSACILSGGGITVTGGATVQGTNCGANSNDSSCPSITVSGSGKVIATTVSTTASCVSAPQYSGYIGTNPLAPPGSTSTVTLNAQPTSDPLANMGSPPGWPMMPSPPNAPTGLTAMTPNLGYNTWGTAGASPGDCVYLGNYTANCELYPEEWLGMSGVGVNSLILNEGASSGTTYIPNGFGGQVNGALTMKGNNYYISGGMNVSVSGTRTMAAGTYVINGGTTMTNGITTMGAGTYYFTGATNGSGVVTGWGLSLNAPSLIGAGGTYYFNGGMSVTGSNPVIVFGQGLYMFSAYNGDTSGALYYSNSTSLTFTGGTYFFNGGLTVAGNANVTFGPGIYYIENGNLNITAGGVISGVGATFVLENGAGYVFDGGTSTNLTAPVTNCVQPSAYPEASYANMSPYDGTDGEGICGVIIYQTRNDTTADTVDEGASTNFNGAIYSYGAPLTVSGGGALNITTTGIPGLEVGSLSDSGSGNVSVTENAPANGNGAGTTSNTALLVQ